MNIGRSAAGALGAAALLVGITIEAEASGFQLRENSALAQGTSFAGAASAAEDLATIANNPAGMTQLQGTQASAVLTLVAPSAQFSGGARTVGGAAIAGGEGGDAGVPSPVPALYLMMEPAQSWRFGLAVTTPFGLATEYDPDWVGRYHAIKSELLTININPTLAYQVTDQLSLGFGVVAQYASAELTNAINMRTITGGLVPTDGRLAIEGDDWGYGYTAGLLYQPVAGTRLGFAFRSKIDHTLSGDLDFSVPAPVAANPAFRDGGGGADLTTPEIATLSAFHELTPDLAVMGELQWTNWSRFSNLVVKRDTGTVIRAQPENWQDTFFVALGARYRIADGWTLRTGVAYDQSPVREAFRTARIPDQDRTWVSLGLGYDFGPAFSAGLAYTHIFVRDADIDEISATGDRLRGRYENAVDIVALQATLRF